MASAQEEVEAWGSIRDRFGPKAVRFGLALPRDLAKVRRKILSFGFTVALAWAY